MALSVINQKIIMALSIEILVFSLVPLIAAGTFKGELLDMERPNGTRYAILAQDTMIVADVRPGVALFPRRRRH